MKRIVLAVVLVIAALFVSAAGVALAVWIEGRNTYTEPVAQVEAPEEVKRQSKYDVGPPDANEILELVNAERKKAGVAPLKIDYNVQKSAQLKADDMAERDYYSHIVEGTEYTLTPEMANYVNRSCSSSSENIKLEMGPSTSRKVMQSWIDSKAHYNAIVDDRYTLTGLAIAKAPNGYHYAVQHFCIVK